MKFDLAFFASEPPHIWVHPGEIFLNFFELLAFFAEYLVEPPDTPRIIDDNKGELAVVRFITISLFFRFFS